MKRQINDIEYLTSEEVLDILGIKKESLYTYVSRGLIKAVDQGGGRRKLYLKADIEKLKTRSDDRTQRPQVSRSLRYGEPIVQTWISEIRHDGPRYRGLPALTLAREARSFEYVADLLWTGVPKARDLPWALPSIPASTEHWVQAAHTAYGESSLSCLLVSIAMRAGELDQRSEQTVHDAASVGRNLVRLFAGVSGVLSRRGYTPMQADEFTAECVLRGFGMPSSGEIIDALNFALVLSAEHELSAPTFVARICASTGVDFASCVASSVLAQSGPMQAGGVADVEDLFEGVMRQTGAASELPAGYSARDLPHFNHPLYERDPRAVSIIQLARSIAPRRDDRITRLFAFVEAIEEQHGRFPNIFASLVMLCLSLRLPLGSAAYLHTLGRVAGWVAHAAEQRLTGAMLRPRARYVGSPPSGAL